jgi:redox-sensitive bicupin YhaK (pirin superfamily)
MTIEVREASGRFVTHAEGRTTRHSFSFGAHYEPANVGFGLLVAHNDELLPPGTGYPDHPHTDLEIVTVVLSGALRHTSSVGTGVVGPSGVQRLSAGSGVVHAEVSAAAMGPTRFVQTWLRPSEPGTPPSYASGPGAPGPGLVPLVGGDAAVRIGAEARLLGGTLDAGGRAGLPDAPRLHVFVAEGALRIGDALLGPADAARITDEGGVTAVAAERSRFLVWAV